MKAIDRLRKDLDAGHTVTCHNCYTKLRISPRSLSNVVRRLEATGYRIERTEAMVTNYVGERVRIVQYRKG